MAVTACGWGVKAGMVHVWVEGKGKTVFYTLVTHGSYVSSLEMKGLYYYKACIHYSTVLLLFYTCSIHKTARCFQFSSMSCISAGSGRKQAEY